MDAKPSSARIVGPAVLPAGLAALCLLLSAAAVAGEPEAVFLDPPASPPAGESAGPNGSLMGGDAAEIAGAGSVAAAALIEQRLEQATLGERGLSRRAAILGSGNATHGIQSYNQSSGDLDSQANLISIVSAGGGADAAAPLAIGALVRQEMRGNQASIRDSGPRQAVIADSFNGASGIVAVNQSAGVMNQQANVVVVALGLGLDPASAVGDQALQRIGVADDNTLVEDGSIGPRTTGIDQSFNGFTGIAVVSQVTGGLNQTANIVGVSIRTLGTP